LAASRLKTATYWPRPGADFLAVSSGVWQHREGPVAAVRAFDEIFAAYR
jgi:thiamine monophosphate synthase